MTLTPPPNSGELVRGWKNLPLDEEGEAMGKRLARACKGKGIVCSVTSDLRRALETAEYFEQLANVPIIAKLPELRTWDVGELEGQNLKATEPLLERYMRSGTTAPKGGEPFDHFMWTRLGKIKQIMDTSLDNDLMIIAIFTHHWVQELAENWIEHGTRPDLYVDRNGLFEGKEDPPGTVHDLIYKGKGKWDVLKVDPAKVDSFHPGPVIIRHATTAWNAGGGG